MRPKRTSYTSVILKGPGYQDLPAAAWDQGDGTQLVETAWELTPEEVADLLAGGTLYLYTLTAGGFQPVFLTTKTENTDSPEGLQEKAREARRSTREALETLGRLDQLTAEDIQKAESPEAVAALMASHSRLVALFYALFGEEDAGAQALQDLARLKHITENNPFFLGFSEG